MSRKLDIPIYANLKTWCSMKDKIGNIKEENMVVFDNDKTYVLGDLKIRPFSITVSYTHLDVYKRQIYNM